MRRLLRGPGMTPTGARPRIYCPATGVSSGAHREFDLRCFGRPKRSRPALAGVQRRRPFTGGTPASVVSGARNTPATPVRRSGPVRAPETRDFRDPGAAIAITSTGDPAADLGRAGRRDRIRSSDRIPDLISCPDAIPSGRARALGTRARRAARMGGPDRIGTSEAKRHVRDKASRPAPVTVAPPGAGGSAGATGPCGRPGPPRLAPDGAPPSRACGLPPHRA
jgi:hypothetical protein